MAKKIIEVVNSIAHFRCFKIFRALWIKQKSIILENQKLYFKHAYPVVYMWVKNGIIPTKDFSSKSLDLKKNYIENRNKKNFFAEKIKSLV